MITSVASIASIASIDRRIAVVESKIAVRRGTSTNDVGSTGGSLDIGAPSDPLLGFDPFGAAYQQAVQASTIAGASVATSATGTATAALRIDSTSLSVRAASGSYGATVEQFGGYGAMPVPAELASYGNGRIPAAALEPVGQGAHRLYAPAATAWKQAVAAARADGVELRLTDSYRSYDQQLSLAADKGLSSDGGLAAAPGTSSHGWGLAVDVDVNNAAARNWLQTNGHWFGFVETVRREPWHWEYRPSQA